MGPSHQDNQFDSGTSPPSEFVARRNPWLWIALPVGCLAVSVVACGGFVFSIVFGVTALIKSSEPYRYALEELHRHGGVQKVLGTPVEPETFVNGSISQQGDTGKADFTIPLLAPGGKAVLHVVASKRDGKWKYSTLKVNFGNKMLPEIDILE